MVELPGRMCLTFDETDIRNTHEVWDMTSLVAFSNFNIRFVSVQPGWDWWWTVDNVCIHGSYVIPVELTSFAAVVNGTDAKLSWNTATETNNKGFDIERMNTTGDFESIGFVPGFGTTTEPKAYSFVDSKLDAGNFSYRLKQIDYDGSFNYSNVIEVEVALPSTFVLEQNYPNPFNPSTKIRFSIPVETEVRLNVYNALGQEVAEIVNSRLKEGYHEVNFDACFLNLRHLFL